MHIGLIGGIGPAATLVYYQRLCARMRELQAPLELTIVQADVNTLVTNNLADRREEQAAIYGELIDRLKAAGAECVGITSLGGHFCFDETARISSLPLVSAVAPLDDYFASQRISRVGLLGTRVVMRTRLYGKLVRTSAVACDDDIERLGQTYQDIAVSGVCNEVQRAILIDAGRRMIDEQGAEAIVLAGTDLGLAFDGHHTGYRVIDALDVHVALLADLAANRATPQQLMHLRPA
jgi:aspartate racemase